LTWSAAAPYYACAYLPAAGYRYNCPAIDFVLSGSLAIAKHRILIVDDNRDAATSLAMLLKLTGHETHVAHDGHDALEMAATLLPEVVLLDIGLPKLNGYDVCRRIREQPSGKNIVLVALTGWGHEDDRQKSKDAGFNAHLVKPVDHAALAKLLAELAPPSHQSEA
jgi:CheY-like chemotaxis protein